LLATPFITVLIHAALIRGMEIQHEKEKHVSGKKLFIISMLSIIHKSLWNTTVKFLFTRNPPEKNNVICLGEKSTLVNDLKYEAYIQGLS
jgi:hypothetical protein